MKQQRPLDVVRGPITNLWTIAADNGYLFTLVNPLLRGPPPRPEVAASTRREPASFACRGRELVRRVNEYLRQRWHKDMSMLGKVEDLVALVNPGSRLRRGLELLQNCLAGRLPEVVSQVSSLQPGETRRVTVNGDALYLLIQCYKTRRRVEGRFEAHARHADLQFLWSGRECIEVCDLRMLQPVPTHDESGNVYFPMGNELHSRLLLQAGEVAVLLPQDAHAPCLSLDGEEGALVRKIVVKIKDAQLPDSGTEEESTVAAAVEPAMAGLSKYE